MPTRILREGIITSEKVNSLSPEAEIFYRRVMSVMDDYGRYHANPAILRPACYPLQLEKVSEATVNRSLSECLAAGLLVLYDGGKHLYCPNFRQQTRFKSKFPEPTENNTLSERISERLANAKGVPTTPTPTPTPTPPTAHTTSPSPSPSEQDEFNIRRRKAQFQEDTRFKWLEAELCRLYKRPRPTVAMGEEQHLVAEVARRPDVKSELEELKQARAVMGEKYFPQSLAVLCRDWDKALDRARNQRPAPNYKERSLAEKELESLERMVAKL